MTSVGQVKWKIDYISLFIENIIGNITHYNIFVTKPSSFRQAFQKIQRLNLQVTFYKVGIEKKDTVVQQASNSPSTAS